MNIKDNHAYGLYEVGTKKFVNKTDALIEATRSGQSMHWNFHDQVYSQYDWTRRPQGTLRDLYRQRAQQIRDQYDYVVVHFSGGADSWTVLHSFLSNNIHVDEIYSRWAFAERKYRDPTFQDTREINLGSEYEFAALPVLKDVEKRFPNIQIYIDDYSSDYEKDVDDNTLKFGGAYLNLGVFYRFGRRSPMEIAASEAGKRVAVIYGLDKIRYCCVDDMVYAYFDDRVAGTDLDPSRNIVPFYWSPDLPEIPIMQAHEMKSFYESNPDMADELNKFKRETYTRVCYPDYNPETFQVSKPIGTEIWQSASWIYKYNPRHIDSWQWSVNQYANNIDPEFCEWSNKSLRLGYKANRSHLYKLGPYTRLDI